MSDAHDLEKLVLPSDPDGLRQLVNIAVQRGYEAAVLDISDAALGRAEEWHTDCPIVTFLRVLRNDEDFSQHFIAEMRRRRETR